MGQDGARWRQDGAKMGRDGAKLSQDGGKMGPYGAKVRPRWGKTRFLAGGGRRRNSSADGAWRFGGRRDRKAGQKQKHVGAEEGQVLCLHGRELAEVPCEDHAHSAEGVLFGRMLPEGAPLLQPPVYVHEHRSANRGDLVDDQEPKHIQPSMAD